MVLNGFVDNDIACLVNAKVLAISQTVREIPDVYFIFSCIQATKPWLCRHNKWKTKIISPQNSCFCVVSTESMINKFCNKFFNKFSYLTNSLPLLYIRCIKQHCINPTRSEAWNGCITMSGEQFSYYPIYILPQQY